MGHVLLEDPHERTLGCLRPQARKPARIPLTYIAVKRAALPWVRHKSIPIDETAFDRDTSIGTGQPDGTHEESSDNA